MAAIKEDCRDKEYDCLVGISGGVDSSYVIYLGHKYGLRMLAVHIDDGFDTAVTTQNIENLCRAARTKLLVIQPDIEQYKDLTLSLFKASIPNLAIAQDNILIASLNRIAREFKMKYFLSGSNFATECILERGKDGVVAADCTHIKAIHGKFGTKPLDKLTLISLPQKFIFDRYFSKVRKIYPLNYINYDLKTCLKELEEFCGYTYYGGKHHESILTRFLQCYYLPVKYNLDKRKSHFSSMIVSGQMTREEALKKLAQPPYSSEELKEHDFNFIAEYLGLGRRDFEKLIALPPRKHTDYPRSILHNYAGIARKFRKYLG